MYALRDRDRPPSAALVTPLEHLERAMPLAECDMHELNRPIPLSTTYHGPSNYRADGTTDACSPPGRPGVPWLIG